MHSIPIPISIKFLFIYVNIEMQIHTLRSLHRMDKITTKLINTYFKIIKSNNRLILKAKKRMLFIIVEIKKKIIDSGITLR